MKIDLRMPMTRVDTYTIDDLGYKVFTINSTNKRYKYYRPPNNTTIILCYDMNAGEWITRDITEDDVNRDLTDDELNSCIRYLKEKKLFD